MGLRYETQLMNNNGCVWVWVWVQTLVSCPPGGWSHLLLHFKHRPKVKKKERKKKQMTPGTFFLCGFFSLIKILLFSIFSNCAIRRHIGTLWEASWTLKWWTCRKFWTLRKSRTFRSDCLFYEVVYKKSDHFTWYSYYYEVADKKEPSPAKHSIIGGCAVFLMEASVGCQTNIIQTSRINPISLFKNL